MWRASIRLENAPLEGLKMSAQSSGLLKKLLALPLQERIETIANDVSTRADKFRALITFRLL
jgi:hypothetical protein